MENNDIVDAEVVDGPKDKPRKEINWFHAVSYFVFFLPYCNKKSLNKDEDAWYANQGLLHLILYLIFQAMAVIGWMIPVLGIFIAIGAILLYVLVAVSALVGMIQVINGRTYEMPIFGKIRIIK